MSWQPVRKKFYQNSSWILGWKMPFFNSRWSEGVDSAMQHICGGVSEGCSTRWYILTFVVRHKGYFFVNAYNYIVKLADVIKFVKHCVWTALAHRYGIIERMCLVTLRHFPAFIGCAKLLPNPNDFFQATKSVATDATLLTYLLNNIRLKHRGTWNHFSKPSVGNQRQNSFVGWNFNDKVVDANESSKISAEVSSVCMALTKVAVKNALGKRPNPKWIIFWGLQLIVWAWKLRHKPSITPIHKLRAQQLEGVRRTLTNGQKEVKILYHYTSLYVMW